MLKLCIVGMLLLAPTGFGQTEQKFSGIEGSVMNEITGEPVNRAAVTAMRMMDGGAARPGNFSNRMMGAPQGSTTYTDAEGKFRFASLEPGRYSVLARKRGFVDPRPGVARPANNFTLTAGQTKSGLQFKLVPQAIIAGRVYDEAGEPVQNAQVRAMVRRRISGRMVWTGTQGNAVTNDRGEYRLSGLGSGQYAVAADFHDQFEMNAPVYEPRPQAYVTTYFPQASTESGAQLVEVSAGNETAGIDIHLQKDSTYRISGRVTGGGEIGRNFSVQALPRDMSPMGMRGPGGSMRTGENGAFEISGVRRGSYMITAQTHGPDGGRMSGATPVEVGNDDLSDVVIRLGAGTSITGTFVLEGQGGKANWPAMSINLQTREGRMFGGMRPARVGEDGTFSSTIEMPMKYLINVSGSPPSNAYLASIRIGSEEYLGREVDFSGGSPGPIRIIYRTDGGKVSGTVERLEGGESGVQEMVVLMPKDPALRQYPFIQIRPVAPQGASSFTFNNVRPGEYLIWAVQGFEYQAFDGGDLPKELEETAVKVRVDPGGDQNVQLKEIKSPKVD